MSTAARSPAAPMLYLGAAATVVALHLATIGTLGFHTDELYYLDCGRHLALGYVDFPPVVPLLARLETGLLGVTPFALRVLPSLAGGFLTILCGLYVRRLGGPLRLQALAILAGGIAAPLLIGSNWVFQTVTFDQVTWMVALYFFVRLVVDRRQSDWLYLGGALGIGLEVKYTIAALILGIALATLTSSELRGDLRTRSPWVGAAIALLLWSPNLVWQIANRLPTLTYASNHREGAASYLVEFAVVMALLLPLWVAGLVSFFRNPRLRPLGTVCLLPPLLFLVVGGKGYYAAPAVPLAMAQGLIAISRLEHRRLRVGLQIVVAIVSVLQFLALSSITLPITPPDRLHTTGLDAKNEVFADSVGWQGVANQVLQVYEGLPPGERSGTVVISKYYGVPGALQVYVGPAHRPAAYSPQLSDWYWLPSDLSATEAIMVDYEPSDVSWMCSAPVLITRLTVPYQVQGLEQGAPVTLCRLKAPMPAVWDRLRSFS